MGRVSTAFRAFFGALFNAETAIRVQDALRTDVPQTSEVIPLAPVKPSEPAARPVLKSTQSDAITLLATLQREARLVDFLQEDLGGYSDDQVGAAVREIHRDSGAVLSRFFAIRPILADEEGASVKVPAAFDAARYRLTGKLTGEAPFQGTLRHHGWEASRCELPAYTGSETSARTIAPAEVEVH
jgi:hypothetical protein